MNNYTAVIGFQGYLNQNDVDRLVIPNFQLIRAEPNGEGGIRLSNGEWLKSHGDEEHQLMVDFASNHLNCEVIARALQEDYLAHLSLVLNTPIRKPRLIKIVNRTSNTSNQATHFISPKENVFTYANPLNQDEIKKANDLLSSLADNAPDVISQLISDFSEALSAEDNYKKFWKFYNLLARLTESKGGKAERVRVNSRLLERYPDDEQHVSDFERIKYPNSYPKLHIVGVIRDTMSHTDATYDGKAVDIQSNIDLAVHRMRVITQEILIEELQKSRLRLTS